MQIHRTLVAVALAAVMPFLAAQDASTRQNPGSTSVRTANSDSTANTNTSSKAQTRPVTSAAKPSAATGDLLDLNTATADQLKALPGVGDAYTKRIIDGRPYTSKNQLVQRGVVPQKTYDGIKEKIVAHRPAPKK